MGSRDEVGAAPGLDPDTDARPSPSSSGSLASSAWWLTRLVGLAIDIDFAWFFAGFIFTMTAGGIATQVVPRTLPYYLDDARYWGRYAGDGTVPFWQVGIVIGFVFPVLIFLMEFSSTRSARKSLRWALALMAALGMTTGTTETVKSLTGFLRPDFGQRCLGVETVFPALGDINPDLLPRVILKDEDCPAFMSGGGRKRLHDGRRSFPSGHTSVSTGGGIFLVGYVLYWGAHHPARRALPGRGTRVTGHGKAMGRVVATQFLEVLIVFLALGYAGYASVSRLIDYRHHPADVVGGALIGVTFSLIFLVRNILHNAVEQSHRNEPVALDGGPNAWARDSGR